jgi:N-acetylated-alpha-linked acidic dipeptidase
LLGSTEWVETHAELLKQKAAVYINSDNNGRGFLRAGGSHTLEKFVNELARDVIDPQKKITVAERLRAYRIVKGSPDDRRDTRARADFRIGALGSGSDYTPFLQHLGIATLDIRYGGEDGGGSYHSVYDSFDHYTRFGDTNFDYGIALAQTVGRAVLRLANADILPFEFNNFAETVATYVKELVKLTDDMREETREKERQARDKSLEAVFDPTQAYVLPRTEQPVPYLNFAPLENSLARLQESARNFETVKETLRTSGKEITRQTQRSLDETLMKTEQALTRREGLPRRPWYQHQIYAPGFYTGYGVKTFPGVREAIEQRKWAEAGEQWSWAKTLERFADEIDRARELIAKGMTN